MGLAVLVLGLAVFLASHLFVRSRSRRAAAMARLGEIPYRIVFSLVSILAVVLIVIGFAQYRAAEWIDIWYPPLWMRHVTVVLVLPAVILLVAAFVPGHLKIWSKYPALVAVKLWALAHLLSNGDLGSILMFGTFLAWAVIARIALKRQPPEGTKPLPSERRLWINDAVAVIAGMLIYLALGFVFHPLYIGVPVFGA